MEILLIIAAVVGIIAGLIQLLDYLEKRKEKKTSPSASLSVGSKLSAKQTATKVKKGKNHIAIPITSLIGRDKEIAAIEKLLRNDQVRLLTIVGPGGVGKTRLALKVANDLVDEFDDGVFFVSLADIRDYSLIIPIIAQVLNIHEIGVQTSMQQIIECLESKKTLLVVDNFEQVVQAAPQISPLLTQCPLVTLLITSRVPLRVNGENQFPVLPLEIPD